MKTFNFTSICGYHSTILLTDKMHFTGTILLLSNGFKVALQVPVNLYAHQGQFTFRKLVEVFIYLCAAFLNLDLQTVSRHCIGGWARFSIRWYNNYYHNFFSYRTPQSATPPFLFFSIVVSFRKSYLWNHFLTDTDKRRIGKVNK